MKNKSLNVTTIFAAIVACSIVYYGGLKTVKNPMMFLDGHALLLVVGGTIAASLLAYPLAHLSQVFDFILFGVFRYRKTDYVTLIEEFADIQQGVINQDGNISYRSFSHPFMAECVNLLMKKSLTVDEMASLLQDRVYVFNRRYLQDAKILNSIAKYPPAFGLLGATTGMISMMTNLGGPGGTAAIGEAMALALVATFWGIALANFVFLPLADNAQKAFLSDEFTRTFIRDGAMLIKTNVDRRYLIEKLASMLPLEERSAARGSFATYPIKEHINVVEIFANQKKKKVRVEHNQGKVQTVPVPEVPQEEPVSEPYVDDGPADNLAELRKQMKRKS